MTPRACIDCTRTARPGRARCGQHDRPRGSAPGTNAASSMRRLINRRGRGYCTGCNHTHPATSLQIDHHLALRDGGTDTDDNVRALCTRHGACGCHETKTATETSNRHHGR